MSSLYRLAVVDDNEAWCYVLALRLQQQGYDVTTFTDVQAFLKQVDQFDLALIDFSIPTPRYQRDMDGPEVICKVKQQMVDPPLLVLMSSFFTQELVNEAAEICPEADAILSKQIEMGELFKKIKQLLARRDCSDQTRTAPKSSQYQRLSNLQGQSNASRMSERR